MVLVTSFGTCPELGFALPVLAAAAHWHRWPCAAASGSPPHDRPGPAFVGQNDLPAPCKLTWNPRTVSFQASCQGDSKNKMMASCFGCSMFIRRALLPNHLKPAKSARSANEPASPAIGSAAHGRAGRWHSSIQAISRAKPK